MAGWDKIRAAAQRPDCIFSAFPDGEAGAMYHPRSSADLKITPTYGAKIENGAFTNAGIVSNNSWESNYSLYGTKHDVTIIAKFYADVPAGDQYWFWGPFLFGSIGNGGGTGINAARGNITADGETFVMNASISFTFMKSDGTTSNGGPSLGWTNLSCRQWHTIALTATISQGGSGMCKFFVDGELKLNRGIWVHIPGQDRTAEVYMNTTRTSPARINDTFNSVDRTCVCKTAWAMVFNSALSAEEIKYLSED